MFSSTTTTSDHYSNTMSIPSLLTTKWKCNNIEVAPNCPRCASSNTKFCYYNNYSFSQPRYFCKGCRRYWTKGGSLRNVPVGGGCRKSRRARAANQKAGNPNYAPVTASAKGSNSDTCIDMAAVFANYVNQNVEIEESSNTGSSSDNVQPMEDLIGDQTVAQVSTCQDVSSQQFVYQDCSGLELQEGVLCDKDILWSEGTTALANHTLQQPMVQVEDCGLFAPDYDQLRMSETLVVTDNWASFDISSYDFYSTP